MKPLISVVIPTYQRRDKLKVTLDSVLSQTYENYEVLIMDDGSTDGTKEMVNSYSDPRIFYNWQENTGGPAKPRNNGIKISKGSWIAFLDDDDNWKKNKLDEICGQIHSNNDFIYHAGTELVNNKVYATGGRVLNFINISDDLKKSRDTVIQKIQNLNWENGFFRKDIGFKIIDK